MNETSTITYVKRVITVVHSKGLRYKTTGNGRKVLQGTGRVHKLLFELLVQACKLLQAITEGRGGDDKIQKALAEQLNLKIFQAHVRRIYSAHNDLYDKKRKDAGKLTKEGKDEIHKNLMEAGYACTARHSIHIRHTTPPVPHHTTRHHNAPTRPPPM